MLHLNGFSGDFLLVYWTREGSVSVLSIDKVCGSTTVGSESQVKLGKTLHPVKIATVGEFTLVFLRVHVHVLAYTHTSMYNAGTKQAMETLELSYLEGKYILFDEEAEPESDGTASSPAEPKSDGKASSPAEPEHGVKRVASTGNVKLLCVQYSIHVCACTCTCACTCRLINTYHWDVF